LNAVAGGVAGEANDVSVDRLVELLDYVGQVIRLDERPAFRLSEYRLGNGQTFIFHQHELHSLPGITHDLVDEDGAVWLCAERLKRNNPPPPSETLAPWLDLTPDPERTPQPRDHLLLTVSKPECDELVATGQARAEDCAKSLSVEAKGQFDVRLRLEDRPGIAAEAEQYLSLSWLPWSVAERPRRRSIALYQKLFEVVQLSELGGAEQAIELVWGIGLSRWVKDGAIIDLPLIERLVEIEIDERAAGTIRIRPRQASATVNLRPYDELKIDGVPVAQDAARRAIAAADEDIGVGPFQRETFEPVLRSCQTRLDPEGTYLPDSQHIEPDAAPPSPSDNLVVSDRWVFFARKRSDNFLLQDLANLKASIERSPEDLPGPSRTLVMGPARTSTARWKPLSDAMGAGRRRRRAGYRHDAARRPVLSQALQRRAGRDRPPPRGERRRRGAGAARHRQDAHNLEHHLPLPRAGPSRARRLPRRGRAVGSARSASGAGPGSRHQHHNFRKGGIQTARGRGPPVAIDRGKPASE
jgi:hypothetical protein